MKRIISLVLLTTLTIMVVLACPRKNIPTALQATDTITIFIMDSTNALIEGAELKIGKTVFRTSWDGRLVCPSKILLGTDKLTISCENYESRTVKLDEVFATNTNIPVITLTRKKKTSSTGIYYGGGKMRGEVYYKTAMLSAAVEDGSIAVEEVAIMEDVARPMAAGISNSNISAGKLTAGEVNDFAKWYFWQKVIDGTHKKYVDTWHFAPRHRYTVQVTNKGGYPLVNRSVNLLDNKGNTLFQAVTDNTGKAELWYQLINNNLCGKHSDLFIQAEGQKITAKEWADGVNTIVVDEPCEAPESVDVVFVFDATGSMGDELRYLQAEMRDVISRSQQAIDGVNVRTGAVVYRDKGDEYVTRLSRLTDNISTTQSFIDKQQANGGGDYPEAVPEALMAAINSSGWDENARARIAFLILDAPCHEDSASVALLQEQVLNAAAQGIRIVPVVCSGLGESGELLMRSIALATNGTSFFLTDDSGIGHSHLKPTTDSLQVEHLNDMLVRTIIEFSTIPNCEGHWTIEAEEYDGDFVPNPFEIKDLTEEEKAQKDSRVTLYLLDISGKLIHVYEGNLEEAGDSQLSRISSLRYQLSTGIYFVKAFYDGEWHTKKILVH